MRSGSIGLLALARGLVFALTILLTSAAGAEPSRFVLRDTTYRLTSAFGPETLLVRELTFASPTIGAEVDSTTGTLVVSMGRFFYDDQPFQESRSLFREETRDNWIVAYDLRARRVEWSDRKRAYLTTAPRRVWLQPSEKKMNFVRLPDGRDLPLRGTWARFTSSGVILGAGQTLRLVVLPSPSERMHQD